MISNFRITENELGYIIELDGCTINISRKNMSAISILDGFQCNTKVLIYYDMRCVISDENANELIKIGIS